MKLIDPRHISDLILNLYVFYIFYKRVISLTTFKMVSVLAKEIERAPNLSVIFLKIVVIWNM
jgi:hypothetical protein